MAAILASRQAAPARGTLRTRGVRRDLEGVRALAVIGVVGYHLRPSWLPGGFVGVDVFFVLSGFFITGLLLREAESSGRVDLRAFWGRRARRLLPAAGVVLIATLVGGLVLVNSIDAHRIAVDGLFAALFCVNWHYAAMGTSYLADTDPSPLTHYWSLGVEEQFYAAWPLVLVALVVILGRAHLRRGVLVTAAVIGVMSLTLAVHQTVGAQSYAYFATWSRAWQLALGAGLAASPAGLPRVTSGARVVARWLGVGTVLACYVLIPLDVVYPGWIALLPALGTAAIVAAGGALRDPVGRALGSRVGQWLGRHSYGWYLWHWPPLVLLPMAIGHPLSTRSLVGCAGLSLLAAVVSYRVIEQPARTSRMLAGSRGRLSLLLGAAVVAATVGTAVATATIAQHRTSHSSIAVGGAMLHPQPGAAAAETTAPMRDGCEVALSSSGLSPDCRYLPGAGRGDVVLVGDSHAAQWYPAVRSLAQSRHWGLRVWTRASCPLADVTKVIQGGPSTACDRWRRDVMNRLVAAHPSLVIAASYASVIPSLYDPRTGRLVGGAGARTLYEQGLRTELVRLRSAKIPVLVIRDNPSFDLAAPKCVLEHTRDLAACSAPLHHALRTAADLHAARSVPGVGVLDLTDRFCDARRCHQVVGATLAYRDNNHLTVEMIMLLQRPLRAAVDQVLR